MYNYQELPTEQNEFGRWYILPDGTAYPSITTVLGNTASATKQQSLQNWRDGIGHEEADRQSKEATEHGSNVHALIEQYLTGHDIHGLTPSERDLGAFKSLKPKLRHLQPWGIEAVLYSKTLEIAGRTDFVGCYKDVPSIVDYKTAKRIKDEEAVEDYKLQLCFYATAHNELFGTNITQGVILMSAGGFPQEWVFDVRPHLPALINRLNAFWDKIHAHPL